MERIDDLQLKGLSIIQDTELFCFGTDAVLLADFVRLKKNARVADLGTGTGILPLLLYGRREDISVQALELQEALCSLARFEAAITFPALCASARALLRSGGRFTCIHRASRAAGLFAALRENRLEPKEVRFVHSFVDRPAAQVLISAVKDGSEGIEVLPPLVVYRGDGSETDEIRKIYHRDGI